MAATPYCDIAALNRYVAQLPFGANSVPSATQVTDMILSISNEMDAIMSNLGYVVPVDITDPTAEASQLLRDACSWGALGMALDARSTSVIADPSVGGQKNVWTQRYESWKKALQDPKNPYELPGVQRTNLEVVKPLGSFAGSTVDLPNDQFTYLVCPPFSMNRRTP